MQGLWTKRGNPPTRDPELTPSSSHGAGRKVKALTLHDCNYGSQHVVDEIVATNTSMDRSRIPNLGGGEKVRHFSPHCFECMRMRLVDVGEDFIVEGSSRK